jgi:AcrR family transcriptional regulator
VNRRNDIIETATRVFHSRGYDAGSLDDVAEELGLRKASLYYYVESKAQLLYWIFDRAISVALERLDELAAISQPQDRLAALVAHQVSIVADERSLFTVFFESRPRLDPEYENAIRNKERRYLHHFADAVTAAVDAGVLPPIDPRHGAQAILGMTSWVYKWFDPAVDDRDEVAREFVAMVARRPVARAGAVQRARHR